MPTVNRYDYHLSKIKPYRSIITNCKICKGEGFRTRKTRLKVAYEYRECKCRIKFMWIKSMILANTPKAKFNLLDLELKNGTAVDLLSNQKIKIQNDIIDKYVTKFQEVSKEGLGLIFLGAPGTGKTTAALNILINLLKKGVDCYYIFFKDLIAMLLDTYADRNRRPLFDEIIGVDLLIIDELSLIGRLTTHMIAEFVSLCKQRFEEQKPTIIIANYRFLDEMFQNFGEQIESLVNEAFMPISFGEKDLREKKVERLKRFFE